MFSHLTIIFLNKLMVYGVVQQVYGVVTLDTVMVAYLVACQRDMSVLTLPLNPDIYLPYTTL